MSYFSRRGVAVLVVASVLAFAPLASVSAYADEAPVVDTPAVESPAVDSPVIETPAVGEPAAEEPVAEEPDTEEPVTEEPVTEEPVTEEQPVDEAPAGDAPAGDPSSEEGRSSPFAPMPLALAPECDVTATDQGLTLCLVFDGNTVTMSINRTRNGDINGYHFTIDDFMADSRVWESGWSSPQGNSTPAITLTPGHEYYVYADDSINNVRTFFTIPVASPEDDCDYTSVDPGYDLAYPFCVDEADDGTTATVYWEALNPGYSTWLDIYDTTTAPWTPVYGAWDSTSPTTFSTTPGHDYRLILNTQGGGPSWWGVLFYTASTLTPAAPTALTATRAGTASSIDLAWDASVANPTNPVVSYTVDVTPTSTGITTSTSTTTTSLTAGSLTIDEEYTFSVTAVAQGGQRSDAVATTMTMEAVAPTAVTALVLSRADDELSASWTAPSYNGGVGPVRYAVYLYADGDMIDWYDQAGTSIQFAWPADYGVEYSVTVAPFIYPMNFGPSVTSNTVERPDTVPGAPTAYAEAYGFKDARIHVTWDLAAATGSDVHSLTLSLYDAAGDVFAHELISIAGNRTSMDFTGLPNSTAFSVTITATNNAGTSAESAAAAATTLQLIPPAHTPADLAVLSPFSQVTVSLSGTELTAHITGAAAGDWVFGHAYSTPFALGWVQVDSAGNARWSIAAAGLQSGVHTLAVQDNFGGLWGSASFTIAPATATAALAHAGSDPSGSAALAVAMLAVGVLMTVARLRRRARA